MNDRSQFWAKINRRLADAEVTYEMRKDTLLREINYIRICKSFYKWPVPKITAKDRVRYFRGYLNEVLLFLSGCYRNGYEHKIIDDLTNKAEKYVSDI